MQTPRDEVTAVVERYARRAADERLAGLYAPWRPEVMQARQERERVLIEMLCRRFDHRLDQLDILEVGCGSGGNLLDLLRLGADPARLVGIDLLPERIAAARARMPAGVTLTAGDALQLPVAPDSFDLVMQVTVFSSLLDDGFQRALAQRMWSWLRPGGAVLWYDFVWNNPRNRDVRGMPVADVRRLWPEAASVDVRWLTLAPPLARRLPAACLSPVNTLLPMLRTHRMILLRKP